MSRLTSAISIDGIFSLLRFAQCFLGSLEVPAVATLFSKHRGKVTHASIINLQRAGDKAKAYQVKQVIAAIDKLNTQ